MIGRDGTELSATEYREQQLANADHLGLLEPMWEDAIAGPRTERYRQMLAEVLPPEFAEGAADAPMATWLWRTLRAAEAAGLDARQELQKAVDSRPLAGAEYVAAVVDARLRKQIDVDHLVPLPEGRFVRPGPAGRRPGRAEVPRPAGGRDGRARGPPRPVRRRAAAAVGDRAPSARSRPSRRPARSGSARPRRSRSTGSGTGTTRPSRSGPSRPWPRRRSGQRGTPPREALGRPADGPDVRGRDTGSLWLIRDSYEAETAWAPRFVSPELRSMRISAREAEFTRARAAAEARAAEARGDQAAAERQQQPSRVVGQPALLVRDPGRGARAGRRRLPRVGARDRGRPGAGRGRGRRAAAP